MHIFLSSFDFLLRCFIMFACPNYQVYNKNSRSHAHSRGTVNKEIPLQYLLNYKNQTKTDQFYACGEKVSILFQNDGMSRYGKRGEN